ncbi:hypothetical protein [Tropicimonas aquimaris]|uniref:Uncharacterized protein n=1 Tax=Tropicimonas aquimaris TaxID=914152 RepID=A0ABW3IIZ1_9RHOB
MIIGVTLLSSCAGIIAAVCIGIGGAGWLAIVTSYLLAGWISAIALVAFVVVRDLLSGSGPAAPGGAGAETTAYALDPALRDVQGRNPSPQSVRSLHA